MSDWSQLHQLTTKDVNFPKVPICRHVPQHSSYSIWYLCSWEDQERENEQGNEKSILEQVQQNVSVIICDKEQSHKIVLTNHVLLRSIY